MITIQPSGPRNEPAGNTSELWLPKRLGTISPPDTWCTCSWASWKWKRQSVMAMSRCWPSPVRSRW